MNTPTEARLAMQSHNPLLRSLVLQGRVMHALMMREVITRFGRENLGVLWLVAEPMLFTLGVSALWSFAGLGHGSGLPIVAFAVTGYSSVLMWRNSVNHAAQAVQENSNLLYHRNVQLLDVLLVRIVLEMAGATGSFFVLATFFSVIGMIEPPVDMLRIVEGWLMLAWFGASLAILVGSASAYSEAVTRLWHPLSYILFPLSGAAFMVDWLPVKAQHTILWLPMIHAVEMIREGYFGHLVRTHHDMNYMAAANLVIMFLGLIVQRGASRRVEVRG